MGSSKIPQSNQAPASQAAPQLNKLAQKAALEVAGQAACIYVIDRKCQQLVPYAVWTAPESTYEFPVLKYDSDFYRQFDQPSLPVNNRQLSSQPWSNQLVLGLHPEEAVQVAGALLVVDKKDKAAFNAADEQKLVDFVAANHLGLVAYNAQLRYEQEQQTRELDLINQMARAFINPAALKDVNSACRAIFEQPYFNQLFSFDAVEVCWWEEETQRLTTIFRLLESSNAEAISGERYRLDEGYTGWIATHHQSLLIPDVAQHQDRSPKAGLEKFLYGSFVGVPLLSGSRFLGTLELAAYATHAFSRRDVTLLEIVASQMAAVLENARRFGETHQQLQQHIDELAGLQRVSQELNSTLDMNKILNAVLEEAMQLTRADAGGVFFYHPEDHARLVGYYDQRWHSSISVGEPETLSPISAERGPLGRALQTGTPVVVGDVLQDAEQVDFGHDSRSQVVVPVFHAGEAIGAICLASGQVQFFSDDQLRYLEALANHAAVAIGNAQAYQQQIAEREQASRRAEQLARLSEISNVFRTNRPLSEILEDIVFAIAESVGYDVVLLSLIRGEPPKIFPEVGAGIPLTQLEQIKKPAQAKPAQNLAAVTRDEFKLGQSYFIPAERRTIWQDKLSMPYIEKSRSPAQIVSATDAVFPLHLTPDTQPWQSGDLLLVPLFNTDDRIIGVLSVANPIDDLRPSAASIQTLEIFANHAAAAIENAQLFELEKQRRKQADTLRGVAEAISSHLGIDELLNIILQELSQVIDYDRANVQLLQEDQLVIIGGRGWEDSQAIIGRSFPMGGDNPNRVVIETQEPVIIPDTRQAFSSFFADSLHTKTRSWMGVPLTYGTHILGLMVLDKQIPDFFTGEDVEFIVAFANQVAVALQNARLFDEAHQQVRQLAALTEVAQSINRASELNEVLNLVLDAVFDLVGQVQGSIWLIDQSTQTVKMADTKNISDFLVELFNKSEISVNSEPFATVIKSGEMFVIQGSRKKDDIANFGLPFPDDVTYVPLKTEKGVIGILAIEAVIHARNTVKLVTTLADLAAVAIESARLLDDTRRRATEMQNLYNLGVEVTRILDVHQAMGSVISNTLTLTASQVGAVLFRDDEAQHYIMEHAAATPELEAPFGLSAAPTTEARVAKKEMTALWLELTQYLDVTKQPILVTQSDGLASLQIAPETSQASLDVRWVKEITAELNLQSILGVPIYVQNEMVGSIFVAALQARYFDQQDIQSLSFVANQASVAIRNAQLVQRLNQLTEELEQRVAIRTEELAHTLQDLTDERDRVSTLYQIARELSTSFELDRVLNEALNLINRAIGISHGAILLMDRESDFLVYRAALGRNKPLPRGGIQTPYKSGYGLAGKVMEYREARLVPDLHAEPAWVSSDPNDERRSAIAVPLSTGEEVLGVILLFYSEPNYFTEDQLKLVTAASAQIATAVNNAELYRLITDQAKRLGILYRQQASEAAKNQAILKAITDGVFVIDADKDIVLVNPKAAEILNIDPAEVENQPLRQILGRSDSPVELELAQQLYHNLLQAIEEINAGRNAAQFRLEVGPKTVMVSLAPVSLRTAELPSVVAVLRDISREAEIERLKNEFISTVSHELRTPMTSIKGYADLLLSGNARVGELTETQHRFVKVIQANANRLTELVNDILQISRIETGRVKLEFAAVDVADLIREVAVSFQGQLVKKSMNLALDVPDHLPKVYADRARLTQVLVNLVGNAWQYTPEGGHITISAKISGDFIQIDVSDTGIGIVEKDIDYVFDRFFRSERTEVQVVDGTGLGLSITKSFVEMLGGQIWVKSKIDVGTTFSFTVPIDLGRDLLSVDQLTQMADAPLLVVYEDNNLVNVFKTELEAHNYQVIALSDVQKAVEFVKGAYQTLRGIILETSLEAANSFLVLEQFRSIPDADHIPILLSSLRFDAARNGSTMQILDVVAPFADERSLAQKVDRIVGSNNETLQPRALSGKVLPARVLIIERNRDISGWLREQLEQAGYEVHCAYNSAQALDMVFGNRPQLIFLNPNMPDVNDQSLVSQLYHMEESKDIPMILVTDGPIFTADKRVKLWGKAHWSKDTPIISLDDLLTEVLLLEVGRRN